MKRHTGSSCCAVRYEMIEWLSTKVEREKKVNDNRASLKSESDGTIELDILFKCFLLHYSKFMQSASRSSGYIHTIGGLHRNL